MESVRIQIIIFLLLFCWGKANCQDKNIGRNILSKTINIEKQMIELDDSSCLYVIVTEKICSKCFVELCKNLRTSEYKNYSVKALALIEDDLLLMLSKNGEYRQLLTCADEVLFANKDSIEKKILEMPSPQIIIRQSGKCEYLNYKQSLAFSDGLLKIKE